MRKTYYLKIEKTPGNWWVANLYSKIFQGEEFVVEEEGEIKTDAGYLFLLQLIQQAGWYDNYLNL